MSEDKKWVKLGYAAVDSGQLMVCDPCYLESEWESYDRIYVDKETGKEYKFETFEDFVKMRGQPFLDGKTIDKLEKEGRLDIKTAPPGEFSYEGACETTLSDKQAGQLNFNKGHKGAGVVFSSGWGDGEYPVYARFQEGRIAEVRIVMIGEGSEHPYETDEDLKPGEE